MTAAGPSTPVTRDSSLKLAFVLALTISFAAAAILFQTNADPEQGSELGRNRRLGTGDQSLADVGQTATPLPTARPRSQAVVKAPEDEPDDLTGSAPPFPTLGRYVYNVQGTESASFTGSRSFPNEMAMTVHRETDQQTLELESDELIFDLELSSNHKEREIVAYRRDGISFTYESSMVTIGSMTRNSGARYSPPLLQIPIPVKDGDSRNGSTRSIGPNGTETAFDDWTVEVHGADQIDAMGETIDTLVVTFESKTRPGYDETITRSRTYWLSPERSIWVKFIERLTRTTGSGLTRMSYNSDYTATLSRIEPLEDS
jgi:hypothetical protein